MDLWVPLPRAYKQAGVRPALAKSAAELAMEVDNEADAGQVRPPINRFDLLLGEIWDRMLWIGPSSLTSPILVPPLLPFPPFFFQSFPSPSSHPFLPALRLAGGDRVHWHAQAHPGRERR